MRVAGCTSLPSSMRRIFLFAGLILLLLLPTLCVSAGPTAPEDDPQLTATRLRGQGWWPTDGRPAAAEYAGTQTCSGCHQEIAEVQSHTRMAHAATRASETRVLQMLPHLAKDMGSFRTTITSADGRSEYAVAQGADSRSGEVAWALGDGKLGYTFLLRSGADLYESQLSFFAKVQTLDLTPGHEQPALGDLTGAFGEVQTEHEAARCLGCHITAVSKGGRFLPDSAAPGVTCEACHGPGAAHAKAMQQGHAEEGMEAIVNPGALSPVAQVDFCGACHRAPRDVTDAKDFTPINIRFQPYRLSKSKCWKRPDERLECTACHDPHHRLVQDVAAYDEKCLACHANRNEGRATPLAATHATNAEGKSPACPVGTSKCVQCHMPRYNVPQMHGAFTDHDIRIVRAGEPFPL